MAINPSIIGKKGPDNNKINKPPKAIPSKSLKGNLISGNITIIIFNSFALTSKMKWMLKQQIQAYQPFNEQEAFEMLQKMSGKMHEVITSVSIKSANFHKLFNDTTRVFFKELSNDEILFYIKNYQPFDKAGAYGIQEWIGFIGIEKIEGSYFNVMGLPVHKLYEELMKL